jgi:hypothetical protein
MNTASATVVEVEALVECFVQGSVGRQIDARPGAGPAGEHRDGHGHASVRAPGELASQCRLDHLTESLAPLAAPSFGGAEELVIDGHRGAHDAEARAS